MKTISIVSAFIFVGLIGCESEKTENPVVPGSDVIFAEGNGGDAIGAPPAPAEEEPQIGDTPETPAPSDEGGDLELAVTPLADLPARLKVCVEQGVTGQVVDGLFQCNQQAITDCNVLTDGQKRSALTYAAANLAGYSLWACSEAEDGTPNLHYYMTNDISLMIFNLAIQKAPAQ